MANTQTAAAKDGLQEEERLEDALHRLDQLHLELRQLRSALPRMLEPLQAKHPSPQAAFAAYMQSIDGTKREIASFQQAVLTTQSDGVFARARESQTANPRGLKQWRARDDPDWASREPKRPRVS